MAYRPKKNHIAGACALLLFISSQTSAQTETQLSPVVVTGESENYFSNEVQATNGKWLDQARSTASITRKQIDETLAQKVSEVLRNDSSVQANYSPLGYYEAFSIRGFALDFGTAYQLNGMPLAAEAHIPLENKERVEIIKGLSSQENGAISPGGYVNFVTKRPTHINQATVGYGERGTFSQSVDFGRWLNQEKTLGIRLNAANETIRPYAREATGDRQFISASIDSILSSKTKIETDFDYQKKEQFTQPGMQLLGGTSLPPINPQQVLALQPWRKPTKTEHTNFGTRLFHELDNGWKLNAGYQISRIVTDDNSSFPWGCASEVYNTYNYDSYGIYGRYKTGSNYFCSNGDFTISDFHSKNELHQNQQGKFDLSNQLNYENLIHVINFGFSRFHRRVAQPNYVWTDANLVNNHAGSPSDPVSASDLAVGNIYTNPNGIAYGGASSYTPVDKFGYSNTQDSINFNNLIETKNGYVYQLGGKVINSREEWATPYLLGNSDKTRFLPALSISKKLSSNSQAYGSYSKGLELGGRAPIIAYNANVVLPVKITEQFEFGIKNRIDSRTITSLSIFEIKKPYEYTTIDGIYYGNFVQRGEQIHRGLEGGISSQISKRLTINSSASLIQAKTYGTGDIFTGKYAMNVPKFKMSMFANYKLPELENTSLIGGWLYEGSKYAKRDNSVSVPAYHRFDLGLSQAIKLNQHKTKFNLFVENVFDKRYWRDVSEFLGDAYLIPGAPRIFRATATVEF